METNELIYLVVTFFCGGGLTLLIKAWTQNRKVAAAAKKADATTPAEVNQLTIGTMGEVIDNLREDNRAVREERDDLKKQLQDAYQTIETMRIELEKLQAHIADLLADKPK